MTAATENKGTEAGSALAALLQGSAPERYGGQMGLSRINPNGIHKGLSVNRNLIFRRINIWRINDWMYSVKMS